MLDRTTLLLCAAIVVPMAGVMAYNAAVDPLAERRVWLAEQVGMLETLRPPPSLGGSEISEWQTAMQSRPNAWDAITTPPPPVKEAPPPPKECPDVKAMLEGVNPGRAQIGKKIRIATPDNERGDWYEVGDVVKGCKIESFDRDVVTFTFHCKEQNKTITVKKPRE
ncbi:MAG: hypothetical protein GC168_03575 [Candidatus Hydrogenedens sp.]|nr:hypothetical protein [Candidatus Hydrogenedens sp.]